MELGVMWTECVKYFSRGYPQLTSYFQEQFVWIVYTSAKSDSTVVKKKEKNRKIKVNFEQ